MDEKVIKMLNDGLKLKDISDSTGISYSTIRKMASINNLIKECDFLNQEHISKIKELGLNAVALVPLKAEKEYLIDILDGIDIKNTTRSSLLDLVKNIKGIADSKAGLNREYSLEIERLDDRINNYNLKIQSLLDIKEELAQQFKFVAAIKKTKPDIFKAYLKLMGLFNNKYCLAKRINLSLWNRLRRSDIIKVDSEYIEGRYKTVSYITNMELFVKGTINAFKVNNYFKQDPYIDGISQVKYITIDKQIEPIISKLKDKISECESKKLECKDNILKSSKKDIYNYFEQRKFRDMYFSKDTITHSKVAKGGLRWLINNDYIGTIELKKDRYQFDTIAYKGDEIILLEAKVSLSDLNSDDKLINYLNYCDKMYIVTNDTYISNKAIEISDDIGVIMLDKGFRFLKIVKEAKNVNNGNQELKHDINMKNSKLLVMSL